MTDDPEEPEPDETREAFADALEGWGLTPSQVAETLEATGFGLGLVELRASPGAQSPGIAIVVDDRRDPELRELFDWRAATSDAEYVAAWQIEDVPAVRVILGPDEQALLRFAITIRAPAAIERRFLFSVTPVAVFLAKLQIAGTGLWLVPATVIEKYAAREGKLATYDVTSLCLRAGTVERAIPSIDEALAHVGAPRESSQTVHPLNRAERRAAARKKK